MICFNANARLNAIWIALISFRKRFCLDMSLVWILKCYLNLWSFNDALRMHLFMQRQEMQRQRVLKFWKFQMIAVFHLVHCVGDSHILTFMSHHTPRPFILSGYQQRSLTILLEGESSICCLPPKCVIMYSITETSFHSQKTNHVRPVVMRGICTFAF